MKFRLNRSVWLRIRATRLGCRESVSREVVDIGAVEIDLKYMNIENDKMASMVITASMATMTRRVRL